MIGSASALESDAAEWTFTTRPDFASDAGDALGPRPALSLLVIDARCRVVSAPLDDAPALELLYDRTTGNVRSDLRPALLDLWRVARKAGRPSRMFAPARYELSVSPLPSNGRDFALVTIRAFAQARGGVEPRPRFELIPRESGMLCSLFAARDTAAPWPAMPSAARTVPANRKESFLSAVRAWPGKLFDRGPRNVDAARGPRVLR